ncbi:hypothetical protein GCM10009591_02880 [Brachybacterium tyrofermentans]
MLSITAGIDSVVRKTATRARVTKIRRPEPMLRAEKTESPMRRRLLAMEGEVASGVFGVTSVVLTGAFLGAHGVGGGGAGVPPGQDRPGGTPARRRSDQPTEIASTAFWASADISEDSGAEPAFSAATCWPSSETR